MILSVKDIVQQLNFKAEDYARFILPNGKLTNGEWCVGSIEGEPGKSLKVRVAGDRAGRWADFASDDKGDLIGLTMAVRNATIQEAIRIAKDWLGIREPQSVVPQKTYSKAKPKGVKKVSDDSPVLAYLSDQRNIDFFTQDAFKIFQSTGEHGPEICFPYYGPDGELVNMKRIALERTPDGKKYCTLERGCALSLFGWHTLPADCREVVITEGEIDAMTWSQLGFPALSVPNGATSEAWIEYEWENLQQFDRIWLNWDNDPAGQRGVKEVARRLGYARTLVFTIPGYKDVNEALQANQPEDFFRRALSSAKPILPEQIKTPSDFKDRVIEKFYPPDNIAPGFFSTLFGEKLGMRPGELTIWTGIAGHGKSVLLSQLMLEAILIGGQKVAMGSFEMLGEQSLHRMLCQAESETLVRRERISDILNWLSGRLWIYDLLGNVSPKLILELLEYSYVRHSVKIFVIDSLMKCSVGSDDYDAQRAFLNDLCSFAKDTRTHINLVAHARKGKDELESPGKLDVKGSSDIINQADNILSVWRNKEKEQETYKTGKTDTTAPDTVVYCTKQRENGNEFIQTLRYMKGIFLFMRMEDKVRPDFSIWKEINPAQAELPEQSNETTSDTEPTANPNGVPGNNVPF